MDYESADCELIEQSKNGSQTAVDKLILRHQAWIYNIAIRMVFHPQDAEEVTQEVLIKAITRLATFNGESKFRTWLYRITANHVPIKVLSAYGPHTVLEGPDVEGVVIAEFPSAEAARQWYDNPAYQDAAHHRLLGAVYRGLIIEGTLS